METIIIHAETTKKKALIEILKALDIPFTIIEEEKPYDPEFVKMVLDASKGKRKRINPDNVWESIT